ncbi:purine-nucleoside phosphorylase [Tautonia plasticadhaerens]|uniref:Purine nucleoside phosphorylase n=1 Tax=Tautonia plasticadhaerens TaxID=2527974 RepID=A0A518H8U4_9BACT|nr:purine-nucleoside phosphorylase [Tautonia plasticadhaerens]QDV37265.1 Purine nucleoside phosphorylase 1 [Tautonia plasticadhaerens]
MLYSKASAAAEAVARRAPGHIDVGAVLGSGLGGLADRLADPVVIPYEEIPHFPAPTVPGHAGRLRIGSIGGSRVAMFQGRFHHYEGHDLDAVTFPIRVLQRLGVPRLVLTAATGGIRDDLGPGSIVCLSDHLNLLGRSPLRGANDDRLGPRFPDLTEVYASRLRSIAVEEAARLGLPLPEGVYACLPGPTYETPAEIRMLRTLGADVVGMSTVPEAIVARHGGQEVLGLVVVSNWAAGISPVPLSHAEVLEASHAVGGRLADLVEAVLLRLASDSPPPRTEAP